MMILEKLKSAFGKVVWPIQNGLYRFICYFVSEISDEATYTYKDGAVYVDPPEGDSDSNHFGFAMKSLATTVLVIPIIYTGLQMVESAVEGVPTTPAAVAFVVAVLVWCICSIGFKLPEKKSRLAGDEQ